MADILTSRGQVLLNKVFRAIHDHVCPKCGHDMREFHQMSVGMNPKTLIAIVCTENNCAFKVTAEEMDKMRAVVVEWGGEAVTFFEEWRKRVR